MSLFSSLTNVEEKQVVRYIQGSNLYIFFELRNSVVNDAVANKGKTTANNLEGSQWIGIRTDSNITTNSSQPQRNFFYLSGGPFTSIPYAQWLDG